jgi:hypothetical protein
VDGVANWILGNFAVYFSADFQDKARNPIFFKNRISLMPSKVPDLTKIGDK